MRLRPLAWLLVSLLIVTVSGCSYVGKTGTKSVSVSPTNDRQLSATDVTSFLTNQGFTVEVKSQTEEALTPLGTADSSLVVADGKEINVSVFSSPADAAKGMEQDLARWPRPTSLILWKNVVVVVTRSDDSTGTNLIQAFSRVTDRTVTR